MSDNQKREAEELLRLVIPSNALQAEWKGHVTQHTVHESIPTSKKKKTVGSCTFLKWSAPDVASSTLHRVGESSML